MPDTMVPIRPLSMAIAPTDREMSDCLVRSEMERKDVLIKDSIKIMKTISPINQVSASTPNQVLWTA